MAGHGHRFSIVLLSFYSFSLFIFANSQETILSAGLHATATDDLQQPAETPQHTAEQPSVERRWEATQVEDATPGDDTADKQGTSTHVTEINTSAAQPKDDFQEELVIRPLHSGDIYTSFQFRTLWETDFRENKGKLTVSSHHGIVLFGTKRHMNILLLKEITFGNHYLI